MALTHFHSLNRRPAHCLAPIHALTRRALLCAPVPVIKVQIFGEFLSKTKICEPST